MLAVILGALLFVICKASGQHPTSSRYRYIPKYFSQRDPSQSPPASYPPHMGLQDGYTWHDVHAEVAAGRLEGRNVKLLVFLRHGEGIHNVATNKYGMFAWDGYYSKLPEYLDSPLTKTGVIQAGKASKMLDGEISMGLHLDNVLVSPLERTLHTYSVAYQNQQNIKSTVVELAREILGVSTCDQRRSISEKRLEYPHLDFSKIKSDADPWWTSDHRETDAEIKIRATKFLNFIFSNTSSQSVGVVSHSIFAAALLGVINHPVYKIATAEFLPLLIEAFPPAN